MKQEIFLQYLDAVAVVFCVSKEEILSNTKKRDVTIAKHALYYLCHDRHMGLKTIRKYMTEAGYDPWETPISFGIKTFKKKLLDDDDLCTIVGRIRDKVFI